jgi:ABC-type Na+ efflux pump permease subunit
MNRIYLVAKRDYLASVRSKPFLFGLILAPILGCSGFLVAGLMKVKPDLQPRRIAIVDRTGAAAPAIVDAATGKNAKDLFDKLSGKQLIPRYSFEIVTPDDANPNAQRLQLSDRVRRREIFAFLDIGCDALHPAKTRDGGQDDADEKVSESSRVNYYSNAGGIDETRMWISGPVTEGLRRVRLSQLGVDPARFADVLSSATVQTMSLIRRDENTGKIVKARKKSEMEGFVVPFVLVMLLAMTVLASSGPMLGSVAEDKMQRVYEMLLASATPFELIMGKVAAAVALSLTSSLFYVGAGLVVLYAMALMGMAPLALLPWFVVYLVADVMVLCCLGAALGSACASPNDAQHLAVLLFMPVMIPMFLIMPVIQQPNSALSLAVSLFPPFTPLLMLVRQAMPGGVPAWQPWVGLVGVALWTWGTTWAAARIFRVGILMQGKTASYSDLFRWAVRG